MLHKVLGGLHQGVRLLDVNSLIALTVTIEMIIHRQTALKCKISLVHSYECLFLMTERGSQRHTFLGNHYSDVQFQGVGLSRHRPYEYQQRAQQEVREACYVLHLFSSLG